ncbi:MAG: hypothetical protein JWN89_703 [Parcubacteria group bacterium]|nr:hypothetical protein [Parcubacteria group bacterium]
MCMNRYTLERIDARIIHVLRTLSLPLARFAIFLVFFWFGILKVIGASPASPMVLELLHRTLSFMNPSLFLVLFGLFEMLIGISFLIPHLERAAIFLLAIHLFTTILPLFLMTSYTWTAPLIPTLEGQYIIKNILIMAVAVGIAAHLRPRHM